MKAKSLLMGFAAVAACCAFSVSAEAAFGLKVPKLGNVIKSNNKQTTTNNQQKSNGVYKKTVYVHVIDGRLERPIPNIEVYQIEFKDGPSVNDRNEICVLDADYKLLGRTDANGRLTVPPTVTPFRLMVTIPGSGVQTMTFPDIFPESNWEVRRNIINSKYRGVKFTGKQLP